MTCCISEVGCKLLRVPLKAANMYRAGYFQLHESVQVNEKNLAIVGNSSAVVIVDCARTSANAFVFYHTWTSLDNLQVTMDIILFMSATSF